MPEINPTRLLDDLKRPRQFGADMALRRWLVQTMSDPNLDPAMDGVGNNESAG